MRLRFVFEERSFFRQTDGGHEYNIYSPAMCLTRDYHTVAVLSIDSYQFPLLVTWESNSQVIIQDGWQLCQGSRSGHGRIAKLCLRIQEVNQFPPLEAGLMGHRASSCQEQNILLWISKRSHKENKFHSAKSSVGHLILKALKYIFVSRKWDVWVVTEQLQWPWVELLLYMLCPKLMFFTFVMYLCIYLSC